MVRRLKAPFQHVYAVKKTEGGHFWVKIDPKAAYTEVTTWAVSAYPHIRCLTTDDDIILPVTAVIRPKERWTFCIINCVEIVKSLLGIRAFWVWTPRQLYDHILRGK